MDRTLIGMCAVGHMQDIIEEPVFLVPQLMPSSPRWFMARAI